MEKNIFKEIQEKNDILEVVRELGFKEFKNNKGPCPKCGSSRGESGDNFHIDVDGQQYYCFIDGKGGGVIQLVQHIKGLEFDETIDWLCNRANIDNPLDKLTPEEKATLKRKREEQDYISGLLTKYTEYCHSILFKNKFKDKLDYLVNVIGFSIDVIKKLKIGLCPEFEDYDNEILDFKSMLFDKIKDATDRKTAESYYQKMVISGLYYVNNSNGYVYPGNEYFHGRFIYPYWKNNRVGYLCGRRIDGYTPKIKKEEKYDAGGGLEGTRLVSLDSQKYLKLPTFNERSNWKKYLSPHIQNNLFMGEDTIHGQKTIIIAEGAPDCISSIDIGFPTISPVTVKPRQRDMPKLLALCKKADKVYIINDNEVSQYGKEKSAGDKGAFDQADYLTKNGVNVYIVKLPRDKDVEKVDLNSYIADLRKIGKTTDEIRLIFNDMLDESKSYIELLIEECKDIDNFDDRIAKLSIKIFPVLVTFDSIRQAHYIKVISKITGIGISEIKKTIKSFQNPISSKDNEVTKKEKKRAIFDNLVDVCLGKNDETLYLFKIDGKLEVKKFHEDDDYKYIPPMKAQIPWNLSSVDDVMSNINDDEISLFNDLVEYHKQCSELNNDDWYKFLALWDMHTYIQDEVSITPYLFFYGAPGKGKSRTCKGITWVSYRGVCMDSMQEHHIFRLSEDCNATLWFDFTDFQKTIDKNDTEDIFLKRFEKGSKVMRVIDPGAGPFDDSKYFQIFGPTMISTNSPIGETLLDRCITIINQISEKDFDNPVQPEWGKDLRSRLVAFRARHLGEELPKIPKPVKYRLGDFLKIIFQVNKLISGNEDWLNNLVKDITYTDLESKLDSKQGRSLISFERCLDLSGDKTRIPLREIVEVYNNIYNKNGNPRWNISVKGIGNTMRELGFKIGQNKRGLSSVILDHHKLEVAKQKYGISQMEKNQKVIRIDDFKQFKSSNYEF